ncbi:hypothetical protein ACFLIM_17675 [Nonomuraea sp. M3C6]|uniref:Uncharacterized protein n=1 Tax=Nonomuraea marmarensis TaxID=3351344 RepID=A0ABW7ACF3_9ACTN
MTNESDVATGRKYVEELQPRLPAWWLMYSLSRRRLVAFYQGHCPSPGIWVEAEQPDELLHRMSDATTGQGGDRLWAAGPGSWAPILHGRGAGRRAA